MSTVDHVDIEIVRINVDDCLSVFRSRGRDRPNRDASSPKLMIEDSSGTVSIRLIAYRHRDMGEYDLMMSAVVSFNHEATVRGYTNDRC